MFIHLEQIELEREWTNLTMRQCSYTLKTSTSNHMCFHCCLFQWYYPQNIAFKYSFNKTLTRTLKYDVSSSCVAFSHAEDSFWWRICSHWPVPVTHYNQLFWKLVDLHTSKRTAFSIELISRWEEKHLLSVCCQRNIIATLFCVIIVWDVSDLLYLYSYIWLFFISRWLTYNAEDLLKRYFSVQQ